MLEGGRPFSHNDLSRSAVVVHCAITASSAVSTYERLSVICETNQKFFIESLYEEKEHSTKKLMHILRIPWKRRNWILRGNRFWSKIKFNFVSEDLIEEPQRIFIWQLQLKLHHASCIKDFLRSCWFGASIFLNFHCIVATLPEDPARNYRSQSECQSWWYCDKPAPRQFQWCQSYISLWPRPPSYR